MGSCAESYSAYNNYFGEIAKTRLRIYARLLLQNSSTLPRTAVCQTGTYSGVRASPCHNPMAGRATRLAAEHLSIVA